MGKLDPAVIEQLVEGMSRSCRKAGCALIGGETAEMPGFYPPGEYDLAGFIVGVVERKKILTGKSVKPGDALFALPSSGLHTNGYSLARKLVFEVAKLKPDTYVAEVGNKIGAELLKPHLCYAPALKNIVARGWVSALAHITGGGIPGNLPRVLPAGVKAQIDLASWPVPPIFKFLARARKDRNQRIAAILQHGHRHDSRRASCLRKIRRSRPQAPPRKILPHRPHRTRRLRQISRCPLRLSESVVGRAFPPDSFFSVASALSESSV